MPDGPVTVKYITVPDVRNVNRIIKYLYRKFL